MKLSNLKSRPAHTLLFIGDDFSYRMDFNNRCAALTELHEFAIGCNNSIKLGASLTALAEAGPPLGRKTWVLYAHLPLHLVTLPALQVAGVSAETLQQALHFELEGLTGHSMAGQPLAYRLFNTQDDLHQYWLVHVDALTLEDVLAALHKAGSKLGGLLHPGGLPEFMSHPEQQYWLRLESWPQQVLTVSSSMGNIDLQQFDFDNRQWKAALENWWNRVDPNEPNESLQHHRIEVLPDTQRVFNIQSDADVALWLNLWARVLIASKEARVPVLNEPPSAHRELLLRSASGAAVALFCIGHLLWNLQQTRYFNQQTQELQKTDLAMQDIRKRIKDSQEQKHKLADKLAQLQGDISAIPKTLTVLQQRPAKLLEALAKGHPQDLVVETIATDKDTVTVTGVALRPVLANQLGANLENMLRGLNWQVDAPTKEDMRLFKDGGPWSFSLRLYDEGVAGLNGAGDEGKP